MPYEVRKDKDKYCVFNTDTDESKGCSDSRAQAAAHLKALYSAEAEMAAEEVLSDLDENEGYLAGDNYVFSEGMKEYPWEGPIVFENVTTGDNRVFKSDSINWQEDTLPWAFRWQKASGQGHAGSVPVGRVDRIARMEDGSIHGGGVIIPDLSDEAAQYLKLLESGVGGGVSVDGDSAQFEIQEQEGGSQPRVEFSSMRLRALSAVDIPAFNGARIHLVDSDPESSITEELEIIVEDILDEDSEEFYNHSHDNEGKFAPASGGAGRAPKGQGGRGLGKNAYGGPPAKYKGYGGLQQNIRDLRPVTSANRKANPTYKKVVTFGGLVRLNRLNKTNLKSFNNKQLGDLNETLKMNYHNFNVSRKIGWGMPLPASKAETIGMARWKLNRLTPQIARVQLELKKRGVKYSAKFGLLEVEESLLEFQVDGEPLTIEQEIAKVQEMLDNGQTDGDDTPPTDEERLEAIAFLKDLVSGSGEEADDDIPANVLEGIKAAIKSQFSAELEELALEEDEEVIDISDLREELARKNLKKKKAMSYGWQINEAIVASSIPVLPSTEAFIEPNFNGPTALTVTPDGRVFGHLALFNTCHIGFPGTCVKPPKGSTYQYFHTGQIETAEGDIVDVGKLTFKTGHAEIHVSPRIAADHYDNTGTVAADVRAGEDQFGIWVVGALRPHLSDEDIRAFRAAPLSGDWRRIAGRLELVGALGVNTPGFPVPRVKALVASGETETLFTYPEANEDLLYSDYELNLRSTKKASLASKIEGYYSDYELDLRHDKKSSLAFAIDKSLDEDSSDGKIVEEVPKAATKKELMDKVQNYTKEQLFADLQQVKELLDDPDVTMPKKVRDGLGELYQAFNIIGRDSKNFSVEGFDLDIVTASGLEPDEWLTKLEMSGMDVVEFYNICHDKEGRFCEGKDGPGRTRDKIVSGRHDVTDASGPNPHAPHPNAPGHTFPDPSAIHYHARPLVKTKTSGPSGPSGPGPSGPRPQQPQQPQQQGGGGVNHKTYENFRQARTYAVRWGAASTIALAALNSPFSGVLHGIASSAGLGLIGSPAILALTFITGAAYATKWTMAARRHRIDYNHQVDKKLKIDRANQLAERQRNRIINGP